MPKIKLKKLMDKLTKLHEKHGDVEVIIDYDADDYAGRTDTFINLISSNET